MRVLVVGKTKMRDHVCVGGHDLESFQSLRLMGSDGRNMPIDTPLEVGDVWDLAYVASDRVRPPHVEDVLVQRGTRVDRLENLCRYLTDRGHPWRGDGSNLFDGLLQTTTSGRGFVAASGPLPHRSTGYWLPERPLRRQEYEGSVAYLCPDGSSLREIRYVGVANGPEVVRVGDLVRVSLSRRFQTSAGADGFWLQLSGVFSR